MGLIRPTGQIVDYWSGLHSIHLAGRVHCDVSSGNILLVKERNGYTGKFIDLEYAKKVTVESDPHDLKIVSGFAQQPLKYT